METIREYRKRNRLSQEALGAMLGVSQARISQIENGEPVTPELASELEKATQGAVTRRALRPDLFYDNNSDT